MYRDRIVITCNTHHILIIIYIWGWGWNAAEPAGTDEEFFFNLIKLFTCSATTQQTGHRTQHRTAQHNSTQQETSPSHIECQAMQRKSVGMNGNFNVCFSQFLSSPSTFHIGEKHKNNIIVEMFIFIVKLCCDINLNLHDTMYAWSRMGYFTCS